MKKQPIQKRTKVNGKYRRFYSSGIPMYRERNRPVSVPANTLVTVLRPGPKQTLCQLPAKYDEFIVMIPTENLPGMAKLGIQPRELHAVAA